LRGRLVIPASDARGDHCASGRDSQREDSLKQTPGIPRRMPCDVGLDRPRVSKGRFGPMDLHGWRKPSLIPLFLLKSSFDQAQGLGVLARAAVSRIGTWHEPCLPDDIRPMLIVDERITIPLSEFRFEFARSGGPGGQNVNKVNSKAVLRWRPSASPSLPEAVRARLLKAIGSKLTNEGELLVSSQTERDQARNIEHCLEKVRLLILAAARPPKVRRRSRPTLASKQRRVESKRHRSAAKRLRRGPETE
jgi:ribosome-associated protein